LAAAAAAAATAAAAASTAAHMCHQMSICIAHSVRFQHQH
jgi:hypothetical protein